MAITNDVFNRDYLGQMKGGCRRADGTWLPSYKYTEADREFLTCTNTAPVIDGRVATLDSIREEIRLLKEYGASSLSVEKEIDELTVEEVKQPELMAMG